MDKQTHTEQRNKEEKEKNQKVSKAGWRFIRPRNLRPLAVVDLVLLVKVLCLLLCLVALVLYLGLHLHLLSSHLLFC